MDFTRNAMAAPTQIGKAFGLAGSEARAKRDEGGIRIGQKKLMASIHGTTKPVGAPELGGARGSSRQGREGHLSPRALRRR
jgi:hypothetical protein